MKNYVKLALAMVAFSFAAQAMANPKCSHRDNAGLLAKTNPEQQAAKSIKQDTKSKAKKGVRG